MMGRVDFGELMWKNTRILSENRLLVRSECAWEIIRSGVLPAM